VDRRRLLGTIDHFDFYWLVAGQHDGRADQLCLRFFCVVGSEMMGSDGL
jgi:hypothetical protein